MSNAQEYQVPVSSFGLPGQLRRIIETLRRYAQIDLYGRPQFPVGFVVGEGKDAIHVTPERLREVLKAIEKTPRKKSVDTDESLV